MYKRQGLILSAIDAAWDTIVGFFSELGKNSGDGFLGGLLQTISNIVHWIDENIVRPIVDAFKYLLGIHSPSTVFAEKMCIRDRYMRDAGFMVEVRDSRKVEGKTRILAYHVLLNTHRMSFRQVPLVVDALSTALYDEKKHEDTILDDFTTDVDTFDGHFYSWSSFIDYFGAFK